MTLEYLEKELRSLPPIINLAIVRGLCRCLCVHCPVGRSASLGNGHLSTELFSRFCAQIADSEVVVRLHGIGEPTDHPQFEGLMGIVGSLGMRERFWLFSNGLFSPALVKMIAENLALVEISINSTDPGDYLATKGVDAFHEVAANVIRLREVAARQERPCRILLTRVETGTEADSVFVDYWRSRGFECFVRSYHSYSGILDSRAEPDPGIAPLFPKCLVPWRRLNLDGTLQPGKIGAVHCFNLLFRHPEEIPDEFVADWFPDATLAQLWTSPVLERVRMQLSRGEKTGTPCDTCRECMTEAGPRAEDLLTRGC